MNDEAFDAALSHFRHTFRELFALLGNYPLELRDEEGACGVWSPRQIVAHLSGWLEEAQRRYTQFDDNIPGNMDYDVDAFNARTVAARSHFSWNPTVAELRGLVQDLIARGEALPDDRKEADPRYREWLLALARDCELHISQLDAFAHANTD